jgi:hypothetical protein
MNRAPFVALICAVTSLTSSTLQSQPVPDTRLPPQQPQFGPCYSIVVQNRGVSIALAAVATDAYTVTLRWSGFAGTYDVSSTGPGTPFRGSVTLAPPATLAPQGSVPIAPRFGQPPSPQVFPGTLTHAQASPGSQYSYTIIGALADGRMACGQAAATTPAAPERPARTRPLAPPVQTAPALTVVTVNVANAFALGNITWQIKMDRLAEQITASREIPDIISMTESTGWTSCTSPASDNTGDYDMVDRLIWRLRDGVGVTYRVAYLVGAEGAFAGGRCRYYSGDTVLYNPNRIVNLTPGDVAGKAQVAHNDNLRGFLVRRSLPICNRGSRTNIPDLEQLIDGPPQFDRCNRATPAAPAWAWQEQMPDGSYGLTATLARFGLVSVPGSSFDVVTTHPKSAQELLHQAAISNFIAALTGPSYRNTRPYYPTMVLGDFNCLVDLNKAPPYKDCAGDPSARPTGSWPEGTTLVFRSPEDVMAVALGAGADPLPPLRRLTVAVGATLPAQQPCRPPEEERVRTDTHYFPDRSFSDHCGLLVRFSE